MKIRFSGFTVIELTIVIAVIAILAAVLTPLMLGRMEESRNSRATADVGEVAKAIARLRTDTTVSTSGCVDVVANLALTPADAPVACVPPGTLATAFGSCSKVPQGTACWGGPYLPSVPTDPWGSGYYASLNTGNFTVTIGSPGPDRQAGTADDFTYVQ
jgi:general secretion pathway protein G